ncbi:MAG: hypothetical protein ACXAEF_13820 [Candidatus Thorarchaeota archaeon]|jgi:hypothetical protein
MNDMEDAVNKVLDSMIQEALERLIPLNREEGYVSDDLRFIIKHSERFTHLYHTNGIIESLVHQVVFNSEVVMLIGAPT